MFWRDLWTKFKALIISRKFLAAVGASLVAFANLTGPELVNAIITIWSVFIGATAVQKIGSQ